MNGDVLPEKITPTPPSKKGAPKGAPWTCPPVRVRGGFAVAVDLIDPTPAGNKLGIHQAKLIDPEGNTVFEVRHDTIAYDEHGAAFAYHPAFEDDAHYLLLWRWPGNAAASDAVTAGDGWCGAPEQDGVYRIELTDFTDNTAALELPVTRDAEPDAATAAGVEKTAADSHQVDGELRLDVSGTFPVVTATFPSAESRPPELVINGQDMPNVPFFAVDKRNFRAAWPLEGPGGAMHGRRKTSAPAFHSNSLGNGRFRKSPLDSMAGRPPASACPPERPAGRLFCARNLFWRHPRPQSPLTAPHGGFGRKRPRWRRRRKWRCPCPKASRTPPARPLRGVPGKVGPG